MARLRQAERLQQHGDTAATRSSPMSCNWSCPRLTASVDRLQRQSLSCCLDQRSIFAGESLLGGDGLHMREVHSAVCTRSVLGPGCAIGSSNNLPVFNQVKS